MPLQLMCGQTSGIRAKQLTSWKAAHWFRKAHAAYLVTGLAWFRDNPRQLAMHITSKSVVFRFGQQTPRSGQKHAGPGVFFSGHLHQRQKKRVQRLLAAQGVRVAGPHGHRRQHAEGPGRFKLGPNSLGVGVAHGLKQQGADTQRKAVRGLWLLPLPSASMIAEKRAPTSTQASYLLREPWFFFLRQPKNHRVFRIHMSHLPPPGLPPPPSSPACTRTPAPSASPPAQSGSGSAAAPARASSALRAARNSSARSFVFGGGSSCPPR